MKFVIDASVTVKCVVAEVHSDKAIHLLDEYRLGKHDLIAPDFYPVEVAHGITRGERQKRITPAQGVVGLRDLLNSLPRLDSSLPLLPRAYAISSSLRIGVYDCLYIALAEHEKCEFVTADDKIVRNTQQQFQFVRHLSTLP